MLTLCLPAAGIHDEEAVVICEVEDNWNMGIVLWWEEGKRAKTTRTDHGHLRNHCFCGFHILFQSFDIIFLNSRDMINLLWLWLLRIGKKEQKDNHESSIFRPFFFFLETPSSLSI
jgi:hypothetical protein